jgi:hypothetical protein
MRGRSDPDRVSGQMEPVLVAGPAAKGSVLRLVWLIGAAVVLAFYKPWDTGEKALPGSVYVPVVATPHADPSPDATTELDIVASFCLEPSGWRVYSSERFGGQRVRSWTAMTPVSAATGPDDPRIPIIPVVSQAVLAIGFCAPVYGRDEPPTDATDRIYHVTTITIAGERVSQVELLAPIRVEPQGRVSYLGAAYAPPAGSSWLDGVYVVHVEGAGYSRWFGIQVEILRRAASS